MTTQYEISSSANWEILYNAVLQASFNTERQTYYPIDEIDILGKQVENDLIGIFITSETARPHWISAGFLKQRLQTGFLINQTFDSVGLNQHIILDEIQLIRLPPLATNCSLSFFPRRWLRDVHLTIFEYIGPSSDSTEELLDLARIDVIRTEKKVDLILERI